MIITEEIIGQLRADIDELRDALSGQLVQLQNRLGYLESDVRRAAEQAQSAEHLASDAKSAAEDARNTAQRGW